MGDAQHEHEPAIRRLIAQYCHHYDDRRPDDFAALFTEDATFRVGDRVFEGRTTIRDVIGTQTADQPPGQHVTYNSVIDVDPEGTTATARTDFCYLRGGEGSLAVTNAGSYHDRLVRDDGWRIARRTIVFLGQPTPDDA